MLHNALLHVKEGVIVPGAIIAAQLAWLNANAAGNSRYILTAYADEGSGPQTLFYPGKTNVTIYLEGGAETRTLSLTGIDSMFDVGSGVTLVLDEKITLRGRSNNTAPLVMVNGGALAMREGSCITGNIFLFINSSGEGGGVHMYDGTFTMVRRGNLRQYSRLRRRGVSGQ
jgi:hypothetical protein